MISMIYSIRLDMHCSENYYAHYSHSNNTYLVIIRSHLTEWHYDCIPYIKFCSLTLR